MPIRIVTDSTCDLPGRLVEELDITVVPLTVRFSEESFLDGIDISAEEFYERLATSPTLPVTSQPSPATFVETYHNLLQDGNEVLSLHVSSKLSGTYNSAMVARQELAGKGRIEVVDSQQASLGLGLMDLLVARAARAGAPMEDLLKLAQEMTLGLETVALLDTLVYLEKGGRIGKAQAMLGGLLQIKPIIQVKDGEVHPRERVRTRAKAVESLVDFVRGFSSIQALAIAYSTGSQDVEALAQRLVSLYPREDTLICQMGPVIGTYTGPGALGVSVWGSRS